MKKNCKDCAFRRPERICIKACWPSTSTFPQYWTPEYCLRVSDEEKEL